MSSSTVGPASVDPASVEREIVALHRFFVAWFNGTCAGDDETFERGLASRLSQDFLYLLPGGKVLTREELLSGLREAYGSNPDFRIDIRNLCVRHAGEEVVVALYEEWQRAARSSEPADNGRFTTVLFHIDEKRLVWHHVHETWMSAEAMAAGRYDF